VLEESEELVEGRTEGEGSLLVELGTSALVAVAREDDSVDSPLGAAAVKDGGAVAAVVSSESLLRKKTNQITPRRIPTATTAATTATTTPEPPDFGG